MKTIGSLNCFQINGTEGSFIVKTFKILKPKVVQL
jgi:hypothetical protein